MRAVPEEVELAVEERCEFIPFVQVQQCHVDDSTGKYANNDTGAATES